MKRKDWIIKTSILIIGILVIVALWFMFAKIDSYLTKVDKLEKENKEQKELIERLEYAREDRKSTRLNSSHVAISYAVFCLKKKKVSTFDVHHERHSKKERVEAAE